MAAPRRPGLCAKGDPAVQQNQKAEKAMEEKEEKITLTRLIAPPCRAFKESARGGMEKPSSKFVDLHSNFITCLGSTPCKDYIQRAIDSTERSVDIFFRDIDLMSGCLATNVVALR